jgi:hypothetical protein
MSVVTTDILIKGIRREDVLEWFGEADNHNAILDGAFDDMKRTSATTWDLTVKTTPKNRVITYTFDRLDRDHRGRRVLCTTSGRRVNGKLHYSLRTPRATHDTLVTLVMDYEPGGLMGRVVDSAGLRQALDVSLSKVLENAQRALYATLA